MTHSGGKPYTNIGDRGQRYEIRATGYPIEGEERVIAWCATLDGAEKMARAIQKAPGCTASRVIDRWKAITVFPVEGVI